MYPLPRGLPIPTTHPTKEKKRSTFFRCLPASAYTSQLADERQPARTQKDTAAAHPVVLDHLRRAVSVATFGVGMGVGLLVVLLLVVLSLFPRPSSSMLLEDPKEDSSAASSLHTNRSTTAGSRTAILALWGRAQHVEGPDTLAAVLLEALLPTYGATGRLLHVCKRLSTLNTWLTGGVYFEDQLACLLTGTGLVAPLQVRTCFLDDCVATWAAALPRAETDGNVVLLGAGFDTRAYRLACLCPAHNASVMHLFEVDAAPTQAIKQRVLRESGVETAHVTFCACDFAKEDWMDALVATGQFDARLPTLVVWEGVSMYLPVSMVRATLEKVANSLAPASAIAFDYVHPTWAMSHGRRKVMEWVGEPFACALTGDEPEDLVRACGLVVLEHLVDPSAMVHRYLPTTSSGRPVGILGDYGGFVMASLPPSL
jgi:methyltransferase (TIGR00027 family)